MTGGKALPEEVLNQIVAKTDGVPLFVEELTKNLLESDLLEERDGAYELRGSIEDLAIPATLRDSLMARLDRLGRAKAVAQLASTIGREFSRQLLGAVSPLGERQLDAELGRLVEAEMVFAKGFSSRRRYLFKHALVQDAAYESLLDPQRRSSHAEIARALEREFPRVVEQQPEVLAHHFTEGGRLETGIQYWKRAGQRTFRQSAILEAMGFVERGLSLVPSLSSRKLRSRHELDLRVMSGSVLATTKGMASVESEQQFRKAMRLCDEEDDSPEIFWTLMGLYRTNVTQGDYGGALNFAERLLRLASSPAEMTPDLAIRPIVANRAAGNIHFFRGNPIRAQEHLDKAVAYDLPDRTEAFRVPYASEDPCVVSLFFSANNPWLLGYPD
ncbi:MAG: hypothetical protein MI919_16980, partial [Holophagales bacterium]|nr:hypothetical protein [Holophagales bacterium]